MSETMGERIWRARRAAGMTQETAAQEAEISREHWWRLEHDLEDDPKLRTLQRVACVLEVRMEWLTSGKR
jgi:transcriptional regulator with XRE-family HTH domain